MKNYYIVDKDNRKKVYGTFDALVVALSDQILEDPQGALIVSWSS